MKMVKSLLLGSAAGVVAVAGAQAADLPVKAKPVEYVKVCSLYGAGYYYIPGTDICAKIGGYVRHEESFGFGADATVGPWDISANSTSGANSWTQQNDFIRRLRAYITMETRQQTAYGTLRTYLNVGINFQSPGVTLGNSAGGFNANRAFIQIAGFTLGRAVSYYDFYSAPATSYFAPPSSDAGDGGVIVFAYTAQFGNGFSGTIAAEDPRRSTIFNSTGSANSTVLLTLPNSTNTAKKSVMPDIVANLRVDQAWGGAQIMGALHDTTAGYYSTPAAGTSPFTGHDSNKLGFAVGAGVKINTPFVSPGDYFQAQVNYAEGASKYVAVSLGSANAIARNGGSYGFGLMSDGVFSSTSNAAGSAIQLTTAWGVNAAYEHFWTPAVRTSLYGSYMKVSYNASANGWLCSFLSANGNSATGTCNNDYAWWTLGSRSQWNVTKDFYVGVDVIYMRLETASKGVIVNGASTATIPGGTYNIDDQTIWGFRFRAHRDIVP